VFEGIWHCVMMAAVRDSGKVVQHTRKHSKRVRKEPEL
jgi:hypothetical protein